MLTEFARKHARQVEKFFPRSFDMNNPHDAEEFEAEYKVRDSKFVLRERDKEIPKTLAY